jgi:hypothetical protein
VLQIAGPRPRTTRRHGRCRFEQRWVWMRAEAQHPGDCTGDTARADRRSLRGSHFRSPQPPQPPRCDRHTIHPLSQGPITGVGSPGDLPRPHRVLSPRGSSAESCGWAESAARGRAIALVALHTAASGGAGCAHLQDVRVAPASRLVSGEGCQRILRHMFLHGW